MTWWQPDGEGRAIDPYKLLPPVFGDWPMPEDDEEGGPTLSQGGAALMA